MRTIISCHLYEYNLVQQRTEGLKIRNSTSWAEESDRLLNKENTAHKILHTIWINHWSQWGRHFFLQSLNYFQSKHIQSSTCKFQMQVNFTSDFPNVQFLSSRIRSYTNEVPRRCVYTDDEQWRKQWEKKIGPELEFCMPFQ